MKKEIRIITGLNHQSSDKSGTTQQFLNQKEPKWEKEFKDLYFSRERNGTYTSCDEILSYVRQLLATEIQKEKDKLIDELKKEKLNFASPVFTARERELLNRGANMAVRLLEKFRKVAKNLTP